MVYLPRMKQTQFFRDLLRQSWLITWRNKLWWLFGFLALFISGALGFQLITGNIFRLTQSNEWIERWRWLSEFHPGVLLKGQWMILTSDPKGWFAMIIGWLAVLILLALLFAVSVFAVNVLLSGFKLREGTKLNLVRAVMESKHHMRPLLVAILAVFLLSNVLLLALSIPVTMASLNATSALSGVVYVCSFLLLFLLSVFISLMAMYTWLGIVFYDYNVLHALQSAWRFLRSHWISSLTLLVLQIVLVIATTLLLVIAMSLVLIPIVIVGYLLVAYQQYDLTQHLPRLVFYFLVFVFTVFSAAFTVFQLASWSLLFTQPASGDEGVSS